MKKGWDWVEIWWSGMRVKYWEFGSRLKARVVDTRPNELRDAGLLVGVVLCQRT